MNTSTTDNDTAPARRVDRAARRALLSELPRSLRQLHVTTLTHTLANGVPVDPSALVVVLSAHDDAASAPLHFTAGHVEELIWCGIAEFCDDMGLVMPEGCAAALHGALAVASQQGILSAESDDSRSLFGALTQLAAG